MKKIVKNDNFSFLKLLKKEYAFIYVETISKHHILKLNVLICLYCIS